MIIDQINNLDISEMRKKFDKNFDVAKKEEEMPACLKIPIKTICLESKMNNQMELKDSQQVQVSQG
jgi:hypothetical protein